MNVATTWKQMMEGFSGAIEFICVCSTKLRSNRIRSAWKHTVFSAFFASVCTFCLCALNLHVHIHPGNTLHKTKRTCFLLRIFCRKILHLSGPLFGNSISSPWTSLLRTPRLGPLPHAKVPKLPLRIQGIFSRRLCTKSKFEIFLSCTG